MPSLWTMIVNRMRRHEVYSQPAYWDTKAMSGDDLSASMWENNRLNEYYHAEQMAAIRKCFPVLNGAHVLDLGCGCGRLSRIFAAGGATVTGIDFSAKAVEKARQKSSTYGPSLTFEQADLSTMRLVGVFDIVASCACITFACRNRKELFDLMGRVRKALKPEGHILLLEPIHSGFLHRVLNLGRREFLSTLGDVGFRIVDVSPLHFWPVRLVLAYVNWPEAVTGFLYSIGQRAMRFLGLGDYIAIHAVACNRSDG